MWCFMIYDMAIFLLSGLGTLLVQTLYEPPHEWQWRANIFAAQWVYGILCFPFLLFALPGV